MDRYFCTSKCLKTMFLTRRTNNYNERSGVISKSGPNVKENFLNERNDFLCVFVVSRRKVQLQ